MNMLAAFPHHFATPGEEEVSWVDPPPPSLQHVWGAAASPLRWETVGGTKQRLGRGETA